MNLVLKTVVFILFALQPLVPTQAQWQNAQVGLDSFNQAREFPNYYLPREWQGVNPETLSPSRLDQYNQALEVSYRLTQEAMASVLRRIEVPLLLEGESEPRSVRYFPHMENALRQRFPNSRNIRVMPSAGVVRTARSMIYNELREAIQRDPTTNPLDVLKRIKVDRTAIEGLQVRGVGSDFDFLIDNYSSQDRGQIVQYIVNETSRLEEKSGLRQVKSGLKNSMVPIPDVKDYTEQVARATRQGGSTIDLLAFDWRAARFVDPPGLPNVSRDMVAGRYNYLAPQSAESIEAPIKQTVRGIRAMLENPDLVLVNPDSFREDLEAALEALRSADEKNPSDDIKRAIEQFSKISRNARYSAANNRLRRAKPESLEALAYELEQSFRQKYDVGIPEYVDRQPINGRRVTSLPGDLEERLISAQEFKEKFTDKGKLYHGTPSVDAAMSLLRDGMHVSGGEERAGSFHFGSGGYVSGHRSFARVYMGPSGVVIESDFDDTKPVRIIDLRTIKSDEMAALQREAEIQSRSTGRPVDVNTLLKRKYNIDLIIGNDKQVVLQNLDAVKIPKNLNQIVSAYGESVNNTQLTLSARMAKDIEYRRLKFLAEATGMKKLPPSLELSNRDLNQVMGQLIEGEMSTVDRFVALRWLNRVSPEKFQQRVNRSVLANFKTSDPPIALNARQRNLLELAGQTPLSPKALGRLKSEFFRRGHKGRDVFEFIKVFESQPGEWLSSAERVKYDRLVSNLVVESFSGETAGGARSDRRNRVLSLAANSRLSPEAVDVMKTQIRLADTGEDRLFFIRALSKSPIDDPKFKAEMANLYVEVEYGGDGNEFVKSNPPDKETLLRIVEKAKNPQMRHKIVNAILYGFEVKDPEVLLRLAEIATHPQYKVAIATRLLEVSENGPRAQKLYGQLLRSHQHRGRLIRQAQVKGIHLYDFVPEKIDLLVSRLRGRTTESTAVIVGDLIALEDSRVNQKLYQLTQDKPSKKSSQMVQRIVTLRYGSSLPPGFSDCSASRFAPALQRIVDRHLAP